MSNEEKGVNVGYREIYDELLKMSKMMIRLENRMERIEETKKDISEVDERSREALTTANKANENVNDLEQRFEKYKENEREEVQIQKKHKLTIAGLFITLFSVIMSLVIFVLPMVISYYTN